MSRMFKIDGKTMRTWSPFTGCRFSCTYCFARKLVETRLKHTEKYRDGFEPTFHPEELEKTFRPGEFVFVCDMGDISFASEETQRAILERIGQFPETKFLVQTKNPAHLILMEDYMPPNVYSGTTLETDRDYHLSEAPSPYERYVEMCFVREEHRFISIEPILDFDPEKLAGWIERIKPEIVQIGADNYRRHLPEPLWEKVEALITALEKFTHVEKKDGLERLKG